MRIEALRTIESLLKKAEYVDTAQLGELPSALAALMTDSNTVIVREALAIGQSLAVSIGPKCRRHLRTLLPGFLQALSVDVVTRNGLLPICPSTGQANHCVSVLAGGARQSDCMP